MPPKVTKDEDSLSKVRFDTSPGNANGWLPATEWGAKETQRCIQLLASLAMDNRSHFYTDEALKPWSYNGASAINKKLQQILTKICKEHETDMVGPSAVKSPKKRNTPSADDDDDKKPMSSPKIPRKQPSSSPRKAKKGPNSSEAGPPVDDEHEGPQTTSTGDALTITKTEGVPSTPTRKQALNTTARPFASCSADSSEEDRNEDELPFQPTQ